MLGKSDVTSLTEGSTADSPLCTTNVYLLTNSVTDEDNRTPKITRIVQLMLKQGIALTGRNRTGPPCSVGRPTAHATGVRPARPPAALQMTNDDDRGR